jgi:hypothetical protein
MKKEHGEPVLLLTFMLKKGNIGYDGYKKVKEVKLSVLVDIKGIEGLPLSIIVVTESGNDSTFYIPTL